MARYQLILADPPWTFSVRGPTGRGRSAESHYETMALEQIKALPVPALAERDSVLMLWVTDPLLEKGLEVVKAWGFCYKTVGFYWAKTRPPKLHLGAPLIPHLVDAEFPLGTGYYTRANPEMCLLATRGRGLPRADKGVRKLIVAPRRQHSRKPDEACARLERLFGPVSRLELFGRATRPGWHTEGDQVGLLDLGPVATRRWRSDSAPPSW